MWPWRSATIPSSSPPMRRCAAGWLTWAGSSAPNRAVSKVADHIELFRITSRLGYSKRVTFATANQRNVKLLGLVHLMRAMVTSRIMRTTMDLDPTVVKELKRRSKSVGKSMGQLASELLATSLRGQQSSSRDPASLKWIARDLGRPLVDLEDKEAVRAALDGPR